MYQTTQCHITEDLSNDKIDSSNKIDIFIFNMCYWYFELIVAWQNSEICSYCVEIYYTIILIFYNAKLIYKKAALKTL